MNYICLVSTLRAPVSETLSFVNYHINTGIDRLVLFFDNPEDDAIEELAHYSQVSCIRCDDSYWTKNNCERPRLIEDRQVINANNAFLFARENGFEWLIHVDSDELIQCSPGLGNILRTIEEGVHIVRFDMREAVPEKLRYENIFEEVTLFKTPPTDYQLKRMVSGGCEQALYNGEYFRGHLGSKSAVRTSAPIRRMHIHRAFGKNNNLVVKGSGEIRLLHYDCCEFESWKTKCLRRIDGTAPITESFVRENRKQQLKEFQHAYDEGPDKLLDLYKRMYFIPEQERLVLASLGVLSNIELDAGLFAKPD